MHGTIFKKKYNIDALFVYANAPGLSAYNRVERRMAPLSKECSGIILPFDTYGNHLDHSNKTVDHELEVNNFKAAGAALCEVCSKTVIDKYPVVAEYLDPGHSINLEIPSQEFIDSHMRQSKYLLQIVKCDNEDCCNAKSFF